MKARCYSELSKFEFNLSLLKLILYTLKVKLFNKITIMTKCIYKTRKLINIVYKRNTIIRSPNPYMYICNKMDMWIYLLSK